MGLNPATAIGPSDMDFDKYLDLLLDLDAFTAFYSALRVRQGQTPTSRTRVGLNAMAGWLASLGWHSVLDTNVSPYPTASGEELRRQSAGLQSRHVSAEVLKTMRPAVVVLHGQDAMKAFVPDHAPALASSLQMPFLELADQCPHLGAVRWPDGTPCEVFICPHLRFFGKAGGKRFAALSSAL